MHHLEQGQFCIIISFCFGTELHCTCMNDEWILNDLVIQLCSYKFYKYNQFPCVSNVVICVNSWLICSDVVSSFIPAKKSLIGIYQSTTWPGRHLVVLWIIIFLACDHALSLYLCHLFSGGGHDTFLSQITCKKARIWTFFWLDRKQYGWFALFQLAKMPPSVSCCWFQSAFLLA